MKKKLYKVIFVFLIAFLVNCVNVNAVDVCNYGIRTGDDASTWKKQLQVEIRGWSKSNIEIKQPDSPFLKDLNSFSKNSDSSKTYDYYGVEKTELVRDGIQKIFDIDYYIYTSFFPNETVYDNIEGRKCPSVLKYELFDRSEITLMSDKHLIIYNDDLDKKDPKMIKWLNTVVSTFEELKTGYDIINKEGYFILEEEKETPLGDLKDEYNCLTYTSGLNEMRKAINANSKKSCDNNPRFNEKFQSLKEACSSFRATANYATDDDGQSKAKACSKACSMLNDHVAEMCGVSPDTVACGSLGAKIVKWIYKIIRIVRYVIPILLIILSILEFVKALSDEDKMKDATKHFAHRLIAAALIFIIPFILDFLLKIFSIPGLNNPFCT